MRALFFGASIDPPAMDVLLPAASPGGEHRVVRGVRIRTPVSSLEEATRAAIREVRAFTATELELLSEVAVPIDGNEILHEDPPAFGIEAVEQLATYSGPVFCPACCRKLGAGDSPALGYLVACPGCHRALNVRIIDGELVLIMRVES